VQFLIVALAMFVGVVGLRSGLMAYQSTYKKVVKEKGAFAEMIFESVSLWLALLVAMAAAYAIRHSI
jgi:hypothetical protein